MKIRKKIEYIWENIRRVILKKFTRHIDDIRNVTMEWFFTGPHKKLSFTAAWPDKFLALCFNCIDFLDDHKTT